MSQVYHSNAKLNKHSREIIQKSQLSTIELSAQYRVNEKTIRKWKDRDFTEDKSSCPHKIHYALTPLEKRLIELVRSTTWMSLDDVVDTVNQVIPSANRSNVSRTHKFPPFKLIFRLLQSPYSAMFCDYNKFGWNIGIL
ncbi:MAG: hypothetical protein U9O24_02090 [Campylobacterota bacterium]|nr:hypothetical protein [Campylobacterota bacterium]